MHTPPTHTTPTPTPHTWQPATLWTVSKSATRWLIGKLPRRKIKDASGRVDTNDTELLFRLMHRHDLPLSWLVDGCGLSQMHADLIVRSQAWVPWTVMQSLYRETGDGSVVAAVAREAGANVTRMLLSIRARREQQASSRIDALTTNTSEHTPHQED